MRRIICPSSTRPALSALLASVAFGLAACAGGVLDNPRTMEQPLPPATAPVTHADVDLSARVHEALAHDPRIGSATINVIARGGGVIELQGSPSGIPKADAMAQAVRITSSVPGVRGVVNNMTMTYD